MIEINQSSPFKPIVDIALGVCLGWLTIQTGIAVRNGIDQTSTYDSTVSLGLLTLISGVGYILFVLFRQFKAVQCSLITTYIALLYYLVSIRNLDQNIILEEFKMYRNIFLSLFVILFVLFGLVLIFRNHLSDSAKNDIAVIPKFLILMLILIIFSYATAIYIITPLLRMIGL